MKVKLVESKGNPTRTRVSMSKKEWRELPKALRETLEKYNVKKSETKRCISFFLEGDAINNKPDTDVKVVGITV